MDKNSFVLYTEYEETLAALSDSEMGALFRAIFTYERTQEKPQLKGAVAMAFNFICKDLDKNRAKYIERCEKNKANGSLGGRPKTEGNPNKPNGFDENPDEPKKPDNENESDYDNENESELLNHDHEDSKQRARAHEGNFDVETELENSGEVLGRLAVVCDQIQERDRKVNILFGNLRNHKGFWDAITNGGADMDNVTATGRMLCDVLSESEIRKLTPDDYLELASKWYHAKSAKNPTIYFRKCFDNLRQQKRGVA